ncbi:MAG: hypothetical protein ACFFG0_00760 [Candidatus Thorarchaeota archaeon]
MFQKGKKVIVGDNLEKSYKAFGTSSDMERMKGRTAKIVMQTACKTGVHLEHPDNKNWYMFRKEDVKPIEVKKHKVKKELFDPTNLI